MDLFCVNCGAPLEGDSAFCGSCGTPTANSLPPGASAPLVTEASPETQVAGSTPSWGPPVGASYADQPVAYAPPPPPPPPPPSWGPPVGAPAAQAWGPPVGAPPMQAWGQPAYGYPQQSSSRGPIGGADIVVTVVGVLVALGLGIMLTRDNAVLSWLNDDYCYGGRYCGAFSVKSVLVVVVWMLPFMVAAAAALVSRIPGTGTLMVVASQIPLVFVDYFSVNYEWPVVIAIAGFVLADLVLLAAGRSIGIGVLVGMIGGLGYILSQVVQLQRVGVLRAVVQEPWPLVSTLVLPVFLVLLAGLLGGLVANTRR